MGSATLTMSRREGFLRRVLLVGADFLEDVNKGLEAYLQSARENAIQRTTSATPSTTEEVTERLAYLFQNATTTTVPTTTEEVTEGLEYLSQNASDAVSQFPVPGIHAPISARNPVFNMDQNEFVGRTTETPPAVSWDESEVVIFMLVISFLLIVVAGLAIQCFVIRMIEKRKKLRSQTVTSSAGDAAPHVTLRVNLPSVPAAAAAGTPSPPHYEEPPAYHSLSIERREDHCAVSDKKSRVKSEY